MKTVIKPGDLVTIDKVHPHDAYYGVRKQIMNQQFIVKEVKSERKSGYQSLQLFSYTMGEISLFKVKVSLVNLNMYYPLTPEVCFDNTLQHDNI